jgi:hypothetical protein
MRYEQQQYGIHEIIVQKNLKICLIEHDEMQEKINGYYNYLNSYHQIILLVQFILMWIIRID